MTDKRKRTWIGLIFVLLLGGIVAATGYALLPTMLDPNRYKAEILQATRETMHRDVTFAQAEFSYWPSPTFLFSDINIKDRDGVSPFLAIENASVQMALLPLLRGRIVLKAVILERPRLSVIRDPDGRFNFQDLLEGSSTLQVRQLRIREGRISLLDQRVIESGLLTTLTGVNLLIADWQRGKRTAVSLEARLARELPTLPPSLPAAHAVSYGPATDPPAGAAPVNSSAGLSLNGTIMAARMNEPLSASRIEGRLHLRGLPVGQSWPYWRAYGPPEAPQGLLDMSVTGQASLAKVDVRGEAAITSLNFSWPAVFLKPLAPGTVRISGHLQWDDRQFALNDFKAQINNLYLQGNIQMQELASTDPFLSARVTSSRLSLADAQPYIPFGIIPKGTGAFIRDHIRQGIFTAVEGRLKGRLSQIRQMDQGDNARVLAVQATVAQGFMSFGPKLPPFQDIAGQVRLAGRDALFENMTGRFGASPLQVNGRITDYPLAGPSRFPFTLTMTPQEPEVRLLFEKTGGKVRFAGPSVLQLAGDGVPDDYRLNGTWDLTTAAYQLPGIITKPAGTSNRLTAALRFLPEEVRVTDLKYDLAALSANAQGVIPLDRPRSFSLAVKAPSLSIQQVTRYIPRLAPYTPSGTASLNFTVQGQAGANNLRWQGQVALQNAAFQPPAGLKPIRELSGTLNLTGTSLTGSDLSASLGRSPIRLSFRIDDWRDPAIGLRIQSPAFHLTDVGLLQPQGDVILKSLSVQAAYRQNTWQIQDLSAGINRTVVHVQGVVRDKPTPTVDLALFFPYVDVDDLVLLSGIERAKRAGSEPSPRGNVVIRAGAGKRKDLLFKNLYAQAQFQENHLDISNGEAEIFGGKARGTGRIDLTVKARPTYDAHLSLINAKAEQVLPYLKMKNGFVTGTLSVDGRMTAAGSRTEDLIKTAQGSLFLQCKDGEIRQFPILAKVFSILNVSQLFKFELPDMVRGGMPYDAITAHLAIGNGVVSTEDFFIKSNAMNISIVGKMDFVREQLEQNIGVQPFQTVDRVVRRIPVIGWILSDKDNRILAVYFEAKGPLGNPTVRPIPAYSMAKLTQETFRNLFHLPEKLFTDADDVLR